MVEVVGTNPSTKVIRCWFCRSTLSYEPSEVFEDFDNHGTKHNVVVCPVCDCHTDVEGD